MIDPNGADSTKTSDGRWTGEYDVDSGNTLSSLSRQFNVDIDDIKEMNSQIDWTARGENGDLIYAGERLTIETNTKVNAVFDISIPFRNSLTDMQLAVTYNTIGGLGSFQGIITRGKTKLAFKGDIDTYSKYTILQNLIYCIHLV